MPKVVLVWNQSNTFGLSQDATLLETVLATIFPKECEVIRRDPLEPPINADIVFHLEIPHPVWFPWAPTQIWVVNPEWCSPSWIPYKEQFSQVWVKESSRLPEFGSKAVYIPWGIRGPLKPISKGALGLRQALWILGGSQNKHIAAQALLPLWPSDFPITVTTTLPTEDGGLRSLERFPPSVTVKQGFLTAAELEDLNQTAATHVAISAAEGFGYTAAQAEARSAALILNTLPVYNEYYGGKGYVGFLQTPTSRSTSGHLGDVADFSQVTTADIKAALQAVPTGESEVVVSEDRYKGFLEAVRKCLLLPAVPTVVQPPVLLPDACPSISVLTLTYNRRNFIDLAFLNMLTTDYPKSKIQWVIVDDSDDVMNSVSDKIKAFESRIPGFEITYVPLRKSSIGMKRNEAVKAAKHDICVNMDDDDVYPTTSFRRRVAWLLSPMPNSAPNIVGCTMIAMYDLQQGISAVNTPPWPLPQNQRISEASLCFWRAYALDHPFSDIQYSEGEGFTAHACSTGTFLEIPPQQILVALNHGTNTSRRVITGKAQTGCFWGWDPTYLKWLHGLIGIEVESSAI